MNNLLWLLIISLMLSVDSSYAYDNKQTHRTLTEKAVGNVVTSATVLRQQLGFLDEYRTKLNNGNKSQKIIEWLQDGSTEEDDPLCRATNHFHDPLKEWKDSQLTDPVWIVDRICEETTEFYIKYSNISWATGIKNKDGDLMSDNINGTGADAVNGRNWSVAMFFSAAQYHQG